MSEHEDEATRNRWIGVLGAIGAGRDLDPAQVRFAMAEIMSGRAEELRIGAFALGLMAKGVNAAELEAAADGMLSFAAPVDAPEAAEAVDIVGTGGDGAHTVNISTMAAVVVAATGVPVIKHGNRAASSRSGGADMLEALGLDITADRLRAPRHPDFRLTFVFAGAHHPAMRFAGPVRARLGVPTVFNLLGPLTNPAQPAAGLIGCAFADRMDTMAGVYARRGQRVLVVRGADGLDEITVTGPTAVRVVEDGAVRAEEIAPEDFGMARAGLDALRGGTPADNAEVARRVWAGEQTGPIRDAVLLNAAGAVAAARGFAGAPAAEAIGAALADVRATVDSGRCAGIVDDVLAG
ncbi:anthranilate phosphoribosyltransferase [Corynebacterium sphenisci]|uniref:anthranilate phosphoribosyltransferase n=1 Tax=Corynebacterium sphenisci TaxID=191493 RepID=UPI000951D97D|nr:anthranilate phosphoribosyltransferase [Corynebacterium sphenisci]